MARIVGIDIPDNKKVRYSLAYIKGIGLSLADVIIVKLNLNPDMRAKDLTEDDLGRISGLIEKEYMVEGELARKVKDNIKRLMDIKSYRGSRHRKGLPVRGQRTRYNARTRKGPRKAVSGISVRKAVSKT